VLARLGGRDAIGALLANLDTTHAQGARAATLAVRQQNQAGSAARTQRLPGPGDEVPGRGRRRGLAGGHRAGPEILGFLEDAGAFGLVGFAIDKSKPERCAKRR